MARLRPSFPPDVAEALQQPAGSVSVRYTLPRPLSGPPAIHSVLMETPYDRVLASLTLDTKLNLRFTRTGNRAEGARTALVNVAALLNGGRHWDVAVSWDPEVLTVAVRDMDDPVERWLEGRWPRPPA